MTTEVKRHYIAIKNGTIIRTACGREAYDSGWSGEYDTANCDRIKATDDRRQVTCKKCASGKKN